MTTNESNEILKAIIEQRFIPLRWIDGKLAPPSQSLRDLPPGITPEQAQAAYEQVRQMSPEERRATQEQLKNKYPHIRPQPAPTLAPVPEKAEQQA